MGSATTQAIAASAAVLAKTPGITLEVSRELFSVAQLVGDSGPLSGALADPAAPAAARSRVVADVFASATDATRTLLTAIVAERWSSAGDLVDGIEELAIRAAAIADDKADIEGELFGVTRLVADNPELELALGSRLGDSDAKATLIAKLLSGTTTAATTLIVSSLVRSSRERRVRQLLRRAARIVSAQRERIVATVHTATPLDEAQRTRLRDALSRRYGGQISLNEVVDPSVVGGLRVQVSDDVIDGSISARLAELRQKLAG